MSGFTKELLRDIHQIVNEATQPLSPEMKQKIEKWWDSFLSLKWWVQVIIVAVIAVGIHNFILH